MQIYTIPCLKDNYAYIFRDEILNKTSVVDAGEFTAIDNYLTKMKWHLNYILTTHHHGDHLDGNTLLKQKYNCLVLGSATEDIKLDHALVDNQQFQIGSIQFKTLLLPGHTLGQISFYFEKEKAIFTGDTLFSMGCGRLFEGTPEQMFSSLQKIKQLPPDTLIYCGHEYSQRNAEFCLKYSSNTAVESHYKKVVSLRAQGLPTVPTTLDLELKINPFLRATTLNEFIRLRELRNQW